MSNEPKPLEPAIAEQIEAVALEPGRPLVITDADEVLVRFVEGFERYIAPLGLWLDLSSFNLSGNVKSIATGIPKPGEDVRKLVLEFFTVGLETLEPVPGAAAALAGLAQDAQIVVLTNTPLTGRDARRRSLESLGMPYPVIANAGGKGAAVARLAARVQAPVAFLDDLPPNHESVARAYAPALRIHMVADPRLARLIDGTPHAHHREDDWGRAATLITDHFKNST